jgi:hypothetical protein
VSLTLAGSLVLIARPTHEPPEPFPVVPAPPVVEAPPRPSATPVVVAVVRGESPRPPLRPRAERPVTPPTRTVALASDVGWIPHVFAVVRNASTMPARSRGATGREHAQSP